jgi:hypothetical protein
MPSLPYEKVISPNKEDDQNECQRFGENDFPQLYIQAQHKNVQGSKQERGRQKDQTHEDGVLLFSRM